MINSVKLFTLILCIILKKKINNNNIKTLPNIGVAHKKILGTGIKKVAKKPRKRKGGALFPAGNYGPRD